jgi:hypothetical protein
MTMLIATILIGICLIAENAINIYLNSRRPPR